MLLGKLNEECTNLCRKTTPSLFLITIPFDKLDTFSWKDMVADLQQKAHLVFTVLDSCITSRNNHQNTMKVGAVHYSRICSAAAILLKERNCKMCGIQSLVSMMYSCHAKKRVLTKFKEILQKIVPLATFFHPSLMANVVLLITISFK